MMTPARLARPEHLRGPALLRLPPPPAGPGDLGSWRGASIYLPNRPAGVRQIRDDSADNAAGGCEWSQNVAGPQ